MKRLLLAFILALISISASAIPTAALRYRADLVRITRYEWGLDGPVAVMAAQVQQESGWNPAAHSSVAEGLAEFTPATATWISGAYPKLGPPQPYSPAWALMALVTYDHDLWQQTQRPAAQVQPATDCDHMAFALSAYNGGIGWVYRDQKLAQVHKVDPTRWWENVEDFTSRAPAAARENRGYPRRILLVLQPSYDSWGSGIKCQTS